MDAMGSDVTGGTKHSYTIPCSSIFRDSVKSLARRRGVNVGDMARSVLLVIPLALISEHPDPGEPPPDDRELVVLKSGPAKGRPWRRKPRLQVRMAPGYGIQMIRRALGLALAMEQGDLSVNLSGSQTVTTVSTAAPAPAAAEKKPDGPRKERRSPGRRSSDKREAEALKALDAAREELERMKAAISAMAFDPVDGGVNSRTEALYVLGFSPGSWPDARAIRARFRMLATIHHPDSNFGDHVRISQFEIRLLNSCEMSYSAVGPKVLNSKRRKNGAHGSPAFGGTPLFADLPRFGRSGGRGCRRG